MADEEVVKAESRHSDSPATPTVSNPGTPHTEPEVRNTPPLQHPQIASATPPVARATPPLVRATPPLARATPPLTKATPPARATPPLPLSQQAQAANISRNVAILGSGVPSPLAHLHHHQSKYAQLLAVIEDMGRDIRPTYSGNRSSTERLKRSIVHARILVRECLMECERSARA